MSPRETAERRDGEKTVFRRERLCGTRRPLHLCVSFFSAEKEWLFGPGPYLSRIQQEGRKPRQPGKSGSSDNESSRNSRTQRRRENSVSQRAALRNSAPSASLRFILLRGEGVVVRSRALPESNSAGRKEAQAAREVGLVRQ